MNGLPPEDLIMITHDHMNPTYIAALSKAGT